MKKFSLLTIIILSYFSLFSQTNYDTRLLSVYKKETLENFMTTQPGKIRWENFKVAHMYKYIPLNEIKDKNQLDTLKFLDRKNKTVLNKKINLPPENDFNPFLFNIEWKAKENTYYLVPETDIVIEIFSRYHVIQEYNEMIK